MKHCSVEGCEKPVRARGWCPAHYCKWQAYGDPLGHAPEPIRVCTFPDCGRPHDGRGYCSGHLFQLKHGIELRPIRPRNNGKPCSVKGCSRKAASRGLCGKHYQRLRKYGDALAIAGRDVTVEERFWAKVNKDGPIPAHRPELGPCWVWTGGTAEGYGMFWLNGTNLHAHIVSFTWAKGEIPEGQERDHLCRNRPCVNPDHLEAVSHWINTARGEGPAAQNLAKTHCGTCGAEFNEENTYYYRGGRYCRPCMRRRNREWWARKRAAERAAKAS